ncbi:hypothetical protein [Nannocystis pusilla]|uniref:hypothetical protein n=1 Tax=Nannocystis pusilla TaxID=889268 RepID=UPI003B78B911
MRVSVIPALGEIACELTLPDGTSRTLREPLTGELPPAGRHRLVLRSNHVDPSWLTAEIHGVTLRGFAAIDAPPTDPARASLTRALVRGDPVEALARFEKLGPLAPPEQVWRAHALVQVGRVAEARALLGPLLAAPGPVEPTLLTALRARPELLGPLLRELDPERFLGEAHAMWRNTALNHLADRRARDALLAVLASFDAEALTSPTQPPAGRARACDLLTWRARAYLQAGEPDHARADFERALGLAAALAPDTPQAAERWLLWLDLASLAAASGDVPAPARRSTAPSPRARCRSSSPTSSALAPSSRPSPASGPRNESTTSAPGGDMSHEPASPGLRASFRTTRACADVAGSRSTASPSANGRSGWFEVLLATPAGASEPSGRRPLEADHEVVGVAGVERARRSRSPGRLRPGRARSPPRRRRRARSIVATW